ncbi:ATP-binding cassette domain-containing protein [Parasporobacterium paucivorans]|uniref:NitT/TauT family transport system ATP-binding protein n=1 Tax=Parasporobacterium paucivorans DSM 15970 TaxID=1122934 RepID=A0A1M6J336_9FIRM|nr:ATP-binding cassette domain-containing protein [Parasporobacterium paucivorans]SHJ41124.1 NitT/TauT family transport system ATP-binding protein [Parasporobacterium paucivorans DSM 15970]
MDIIIENVSKRFGEKTVLKGFSAIIREHGITCIMGPSGCGKTTLLNLLMGFEQQDEGSIKGVPVKKSAVFQEDRLCESFDAVENVRMVCHKDTPDGQIRNHLIQVGVGDSLYNPVSELSGGMRRRVALVRAILAKSEILFLDEPFKGLDEERKRQVMNYVKENIDGRTVVMVTHDEEEAAEMEGNLIYI